MSLGECNPQQPGYSEASKPSLKELQLSYAPLMSDSLDPVNSVSMALSVGRHHSAFHPVNTHQDKKSTLLTPKPLVKLDLCPIRNILLEPAVPLIIPYLGGSVCDSGPLTAINTATASSSNALFAISRGPTASRSVSNSTGRQHGVGVVCVGSETSSTAARRLVGGDAGAGRRRRVQPKEDRRLLNHGKAISIAAERLEVSCSQGSLDEIDISLDVLDRSTASRFFTVCLAVFQT